MSYTVKPKNKLSQNKRGFGLGPIAEGMDIIVLLETHEYEGYRVSNFEGYTKMSVWNELTESDKGYGGVTILVRDSWRKIIQVEKEDSNK